MSYNKKEYEHLFKKYLRSQDIVESHENFKIALFLDKADSSLLIAQHIKKQTLLDNLPAQLHWNY